MPFALPLSITVAVVAAAWAATAHLRLRRLRAELSRAPAPRLLEDTDPIDGTSSADWRVVGPEDENEEDAQTGAALRESEARFRSVVESLGEGLIINDWDGNILYINLRITELTGYTPAELIGRPVIDMLVPEELRESIRGKLEDRRSGTAEEYETLMLRKDGTRFWTEVHGRPHRNQKGRIVGTLSTVADITERRSVQEALRESEERYRALFEEDVAGNFVTSVAGQILACNQAFAQIFGFDSIAEAIGSPAAAHSVEPAAREAFLELIRRERRLEYHEVELRRKDGTPVHVIENVNGIFDERGELVRLQGHLIDVTDRKLLEEQLRHSQKMEAVGRLAGGIAHDFNNLLTAITGYTELLLTDPAAGPDVREDLGKIKQAAERAATLTNQLLAFSRRQVLQPKVVDLNAVVEGVREMLERLIGEDVKFAARLEPELWRVKADPNQLEQVLMNLVVNARDAMPSGGTLTLSTANVVLSEDYAARNLEVAAGSYAVMEVADTGEGIPQELQDQIFEPFFTTKEAGKGTGLGLSMAYGLMKQSGGHIAVESAPGKGSAFRIYLPHAQEELTAEVPGAVGPQSPGGEETILLVEDEGIVRSLARRVLTRQGYRILESEHPRSAIARCEEWPGAIHLLLTDIKMPDVDGRALAERLVGLRPEMKVLFISGYDEYDGGSASTRHPMLPKPFTPAELAQKVREVLDERGVAEVEAPAG